MELETKAPEKAPAEATEPSTSETGSSVIATEKPAGETLEVKEESMLTLKISKLKKLLNGIPKDTELSILQSLHDHLIKIGREVEAEKAAVRAAKKREKRAQPALIDCPPRFKFNNSRKQ